MKVNVSKQQIIACVLIVILAAVVGGVACTAFPAARLTRA